MATIFALGSNGSGQLGIGHTEDVSVPKPVLFADSTPTAVRKIAAGGNHTLILSVAGEVFWSGDASSGACGLATKPLAPCFQKMNLSKDGEPGDDYGGLGPVSLVAATWSGTVFTRLDAEGKNTKLFTCGLGEKGELGHGQLIVRVPSPHLISDFPPSGLDIVDLAACMGHVVVVLSNGDVYGWGNGRKGQVGSPAEVVYTPRKIQGLDFTVKRAVCGKDFTCLVGEADKGRYAVIGSNKWGIETSGPADLSGWLDVGATWSTIYVLKSSGAVHGWGRDDFSQSVPKALPSISRFALGSEHLVALVDASDVVAWGWGEHGNCGPLAADHDDKTGVYNTIASSKYIPKGWGITAIGAGCATSWVVMGEQS